MSAKPAFAHSFELLKIQCVHIVSRIENANYDSASSPGSRASYTEHDGITQYPDYRPSHSPTGSDTPERLIIDDMQALQWHKPDDDFANSTHIITLKKHLDRAWHRTNWSEEYLTDITAARAACAWLMSTLLQANFAQANASPQWQQTVMDLTYVVDGIKDKLTAVERKTLRNENDIRSALIDHSGKMSVNLKNMSADLLTITEVLKLVNKQQKEMNDKIDSLERQVNHIQTQAETKAARKNKYRFWAEMPPETHTLPALLERLGRPDTP
jgi:hypothetical protein